jgi:glycosyltransferase involved in cell wall biosynthesis
MNRPDVSVILVAHNRANSLPVVLSHLERQTFPTGRYEVVVVDNASDDGTLDTVSRYACGAPVCIRTVRQEAGGEVAARNLGAREAAGRWLLFLDDDVIPGPALIEAHVSAQELHASRACVYGVVAPHPRLRRGALTRWYLPENRIDPAGEDIHFYEWSSENLSMPRNLFTDGGGFPGEEPSPRFAAIELLRQLRGEDIDIVVEPRAQSFMWCSVRLEDERRRCYFQGRALHRLYLQVRSPQMLRHYHTSRSPLRNFRDRLFTPFYLRSCQDREEDTRSHGALYRRILRYERYLGFRDAHESRPPVWEPAPGRSSVPAAKGARHSVL